MKQNNTFPGGSKSRVSRAGDNVRKGVATMEDFVAIDEWRGAHRAVLNTFQAILRNRTKNTTIVVGQRHKRRKTIFNKLNRFPDMQLVRMDDVAGCRLIFDNIDTLYKFRDKLHKARFNHTRRNETDKYDYIKTPKTTGYR
ncbi:MAG: RelA/SpoT domain-containing protein, partial [Candidatus Kapabacteria bacterium]|nr:RelA/SpoT domain-containing protein [Candidatus Kapabacteria bacterium]